IIVSITVDDILLLDQPEIVFEAEDGIPNAPQLVAIEATDGSAQLEWTVSTTEYIIGFRIYRGSSIDNMSIVNETDVTSRSYIDSNPLSGTSSYAMTAVNRNGEESEISNIKTFVNTNFIASKEWQLVSIPVKTGTAEMELATIYNFTDRYELSSSLESGKGYWVKTRSYEDELMPVAGEGADSLTIELNRGWNLIGSLSDDVDVGTISDPDDILTNTPVYLYKGNSYTETEDIIPGAGHWMYASDNGNVTMTIQNSPPAASDHVLADQKILDDTVLPVLRFSNEGRAAEVYVSNIYMDQSEQTRYYLPPVSPEPMLDVRTRSHTKLINNQPTELIIDSDQYPIRVSLDEIDEMHQFAIRIHAEKEGEKRSFDLLPGQSDQITEEYDRLSVELVHPDDVVSENQLMPNYPNPFNPTTTIQYQLREQTHVMIEVYDVIGRRVKMLANNVQLSGQHSVEFDGRNLASGLYIIRFTAGNVVDIRKMTLVK
uniref:T9SS type A sorting domain-containing protein n=1 Tax=Rhodohalobacter halophilus TaxID=1812810 RepID=UPI001C4083D1